MMKNATPSHSIMTSLLVACLMCVSSFIANAQQICTPNPAYQGLECGLYPLPDVSFPIDTFICGEQGGYAHLTVVVPDSLTMPARLDLTTFRISGISGLPAGMSFASNTSFYSPNPRDPNESTTDVTYRDRSMGCMLLSIPPSTLPGDYPITVTAVINTFLPVTLGNNSLFPGVHLLRISPTGQCPTQSPPINFNRSFDICMGDSIMLSAFSNGTYRWSSGATSNSIMISPAAHTQYFLSTTLTNGNISQDTYTVNVNPIPVVSISGPAASALNCQGASIPFQASGAANYVWSNATSGSNTTFSFNNSGIQYVNVVGSFNRCSSSATLAVSITPSPVATITASRWQNLCPGEVITLTASGGQSFLWDNNSTDSILTTTINSSRYFSVSVIDANLCVGTASGYINVIDVPTYTFDVFPPTLCSNIPVTVYALDGFGGVAQQTTFQNPFVVSQPGIYQITSTDASNTCSVTQALTITETTGSCGGYFSVEADSLCNFFDTLTVRLKIIDGIDIGSIGGYFSFDSTYLNLVSARVGGFFGNGALDFTDIRDNYAIVGVQSSSSSGTGTGDLYEFKFVLDSLPASLNFNPLSPESIKTFFGFSSVTATNSMGRWMPSFLSLSNPLDSTYLRYYVPVWPGDCNNDRRVDVADFVRIGAISGAIGPMRTFTGNWTAQPAELWGNDLTYPTGSAYDCFVDANGDGNIDFMDTTFVSTNLGLVHQMAAPQRNFANAQFLEEEKTLLPSISLELPDSVLQISQFPCTRTVTVTLGSTQTPVIDIYGLAFDLVFDNRFVDVNGITLDYSGSVFGNLGTNFFKMEDARDKQNGRWSVGITRLNSLPTSSRGDKVLTMEVPFIANPTGNWFKMNAFPLAANDPNDNAILLSAGGDSLRVQRPIGLENIIASVGFSILPNPTTGLVSLELESQYSDDLQALVYDSYGRTVFSTSIVSTSKTINVEHLPSGVYWVKLSNGIDSFRPQKLILQK